MKHITFIRPALGERDIQRGKGVWVVESAPWVAVGGRIVVGVERAEHREVIVGDLMSPPDHFAVHIEPGASTQSFSA